MTRAIRLLVRLVRTSQSPPPSGRQSGIPIGQPISQNSVRDRDESSFLAAVDRDTSEHGCEISALGTRGNPGDLSEETSQPWASVPGSAGQAFAGALMVAG